MELLLVQSMFWVEKEGTAKQERVKEMQIEREGRDRERARKQKKRSIKMQFSIISKLSHLHAKAIIYANVMD